MEFFLEKYNPYNQEEDDVCLRKGDNEFCFYKRENFSMCFIEN